MTSRPRVLVAEDDDELRELIALALEPEFSVVSFEDGFELLDYLSLANAVPPAAIVTDLCMPGRSGLEVLAARAVACPVVLFSAWVDPEVRRKAIEVGVTLLEKPLDLDELSATLETLCRRASP